MTPRPRIAREIAPHDPRLDYLDWLTPIQQGDVKAVVLRGDTAAERARERGVDRTTVLDSLERARQRLTAVYEQEAAPAGEA